MPLRYTTQAAIARRLSNRLELLDSGATPAFGSSLGSQQVNLELLQQVGEQVEATVDSRLSMAYELPVPADAIQARAILAGIVEKLIVAEILPVYFESQNSGAQMGSDAGFGSMMRNSASAELEKYLVGHGGIPATGTLLPGLAPVVLPGLRLKAVLPDTITRNITSVGQRKGGKTSEIDWGV